MSVPPLVAGLVDDAAIFPPGNAPMPAAVGAHRRHAESWYAEMVGPFVVSDQRLPELADALAGVLADGLTADTEAGPLPVSVIVSGGAGSLEPALTWVSRRPELMLRSVEAAARDDPGSPGGLAHNVTRITTALAAAPVPVRAYVEMPRPSHADPGPDWLHGLDVLATADVALKLRTGGETPETHPSERELAACIDTALDRELPFKCTAGLHHAVRSTTADGLEQHGFLNVLVATAALFDGDGREVAEALLGERDPAPLVKTVLSWDVQPAARRWFTSFGSCSITEPLDELVGLGLL
ncbi:MAG: hypothetical protein H0W95_08450 [Nocardioidaceae bacterium]|nr:hypothetical protein [Nocardioidaceae bacterium]